MNIRQIVMAVGDATNLRSSSAMPNPLWYQPAAHRVPAGASSLKHLGAPSPQLLFW